MHFLREREEEERVRAQIRQFRNNQRQERAQQQQQNQNNQQQERAQQQQQNQNNQQQERAQQQQQNQNNQQQERAQQQQQQGQNKQQEQRAQQQPQQQQQQRLSQQRQQQLIEQQQQRVTQYRQHLDQQQGLAQQQTARLQQQNRMAQYRFQEQYSERLRQQRIGLQNDRDHDYNDDPYFYTAPNYRYNRGGSYYQTNQYGANLLRQGVNHGYEEGFRAGEADRQDRWGSNYQDSYAYQDANYAVSPAESRHHLQLRSLGALRGESVFGFLINPPIVSYYEIGTALTANHGHAAMMGVYGIAAPNQANAETSRSLTTRPRRAI